MDEKEPLLNTMTIKGMSIDVSTDDRKENVAESASRFSWRILAIAMILSTGGSFLQGVALSILNPSEFLLRPFINESYAEHYSPTIGLSDRGFSIVWPMIVCSQVFGSGLGSLAFSSVTEKLGRCKSFYVISAFTILGSILQTVSKCLDSFEVFAFGRFVASLGCGVSPSLEGLYYSEISPVKYRGFYSGIVPIFMEFGLLIGSVLPLPQLLGAADRWPWMFAVQIAPVLAVIALVPFVRESPRYLLAKGSVDQCREALRFFQGSELSTGYIDERMKEIRSDIQCQQTRVRMKEIWRKPHLRRGMFLIVLTQISAVMGGMATIDYFSAGVLVDVGLSVRAAQYFCVAIMTISFLGAIIGSYLIERVGRRRLTLVSIELLLALNILLMILGIIFDRTSAVWAGYCSAAVCILFALVFAIGPTVMMFVVPAELAPQNARSTAQAIANVSRKLGQLVAVFGFYGLKRTIGAYSFLWSIVPLCAVWLVFRRMFPETKGRTTEEVMRELGYCNDSAVGEEKEAKVGRVVE